MSSNATPFVILGAERTGSNLLRGLLDSHPEVFVGGELFNPRYIADDHIPWPIASTAKDAELLALRRSDPVAFLNRLFDLAAQLEHRAIGFKLMYYHGDKCEQARDYLAADKNIRIVHIKRRNLLRRYLSEERARMTGVWAQSTKEREPAALPAVRLDPMKCFWNLNHTEAKQAEYGERFREHAMLELFYEDLAADPRTVAARTIEFLGLDPVAEFEIRHAKTGNDSLRRAIVNYDELRSCLMRWVSFFDT